MAGLATRLGRGLRWGRTGGGSPPAPPGTSLEHLVRWVREPIPFMERAWRRLGSTFTVRIPWQGDVVFFTDPEHIKTIFTGPPETLHAGKANVVLRPIVGERSLLILDHPEHLPERRLLMPPLHGERMQAYGELMRDITADTMRRWPVDRPYPIHADVQGITLDVIMHAVFGMADAPRARRLRELLIAMLSKASNPLLLIPAFQVDLGPLTPWGGLAGIMREVDELLVAEFRERRASGRGGREDVLALLLEARDEDGRPMTEQQLRDEMITLLIAGHETTATSLAWAFHRLARHPDKRARVMEEVDRVSEGGELDPERVGDLAYLDAFIKETLRLNPIIPLVGRVLQEPMRIGGWDFDTGALVAPCIYLTHRRPDVYPDPERFDPERFLRAKPSPYAWLPFGGGVRRCIGMAFALYEMRMVLATVLARFDVEPAPGVDIHVVRRAITFAPSEGMPVVLRPR